jgi:ribosomal protein L29
MPSGENRVSELTDDKREYAERLKEMSDEDLTAEFADLRRRYNPVRTELAMRQIAVRERKSKTLRHLIGTTRMKAAVAKLKVEMREGQLFICQPLQPTDDDERFYRAMRAED